MRLKLNKRTLAFVFIFLIGLSILLYPVVSSTWNQIIANQSIGNYDSTIAQQKPEDMSALFDAANEYNKNLLPKAVPDAFSVREGLFDAEYESLLNLIGDGLMGYIEIPILGVRCPIYHYTTEEILQKGVGHLFGSSLPVGGAGTHAVLTAHRGLPSNKLFSDLDKIKEGDKFFIHILNEVFAYQVDQIQVVEPDDTGSLALTKGKDYVTLVTCTPYGVNTHRILCRGHRVPYVPEDEKVPKRLWVNMNILTGLIGALLGILVALVLTIKLRRRGDDRKDDDDPPEEKKKVIFIR